MLMVSLPWPGHLPVAPTQRKATAMHPDKIRSTFIEFFVDRGHRHIESSSLVPPDPDDPVLLVTSGMHPLTRYLEGTPHPLGDRLVGPQRCVRTTDLDEVGDDSHLTLFEMLGSWSLGSYSHEQSLRWGYELMTSGYGLRPDSLGVSVFGGSDEVPPDEDSIRVWQDLGVPDHRISRLDSDNWWSNGPTGLCGPDSELFVWTGPGEPSGRPGVDDGWLEVWNHVSMPYWREDDGRLRDLPRRCVDTGLGFERLVTVLEGVGSVWDTSVWRPWTERLGELWDLDGTDLRVTCDHLRTSIILVGDGVTPGNSGRGYVLRRLLRRVLRTVRSVRPDGSLRRLPTDLVQHSLEWFDLRSVHPDVVLQMLRDEELRYDRVLERGRREVSRLLCRGGIGENEYHWLWDTHGLPREIVDEVLQTQNG
jgi:alanyl-tRNA synthetase